MLPHSSTQLGENWDGQARDHAGVELAELLELLSKKAASSAKI